MASPARLSADTDLIKSGLAYSAQQQAAQHSPQHNPLPPDKRLKYGVWRVVTPDGAARPSTMVYQLIDRDRLGPVLLLGITPAIDPLGHGDLLQSIMQQRHWIRWAPRPVTCYKCGPVACRRSRSKVCSSARQAQLSLVLL